MAKNENKGSNVIKQLVSDALLMPRIYDKIGIDGVYMDDLKRSWLKGAKAPSYSVTGKLMQKLKDNPASHEQGRWYFSRLPCIPMIHERQGYLYAIHELFLIKEFLFHYEKLQIWSRREDIFATQLHDLSPIFKRLDPEGSGSPSFRLGPAFSPVLRKIASRRMELEAQLNQSRQNHLLAACSKLNIKAPGPEFVIPRSERDLLGRIQRSSHFAIIGESVANLRFRLRDDNAAIKILSSLEKLEIRRQREETRIIDILSSFIHRQQNRIKKAIAILNHTALTFMLADFGIRQDCCIPALSGKSIKIEAAINLPLKWHLESQNRSYQPIDMDFEPRGNLITGPNMGGKSCALQTLGQLCRLVQLSVPLPCKKARLPRFDHIWINQDDSSQGADLSAFGREVVSFSEALKTPGSSLILLDEFARGTNPAEGEALLCAILSFLKSSPHLAVAATHFTAPALMKDLAQFTIIGPQLDAAIIQNPEKLSPAERLKLLSRHIDYRLRLLKNGQKPPHSAIAIARILGLPDSILSLIKKD